uniref:Uncharacterized protein n=1 Tax=Arundo donax TaxID=35708 RepID=A0A0A9EAQ9_ARUDO
MSPLQQDGTCSNGTNNLEVTKTNTHLLSILNTCLQYFKSRALQL